MKRFEQRNTFCLRNREEIENIDSKRQTAMRPPNPMVPPKAGEMQERMRKFQEENKSEIEGLEKKKADLFVSRGLRVRPKARFAHGETKQTYYIALDKMRY